MKKAAMIMLVLFLMVTVGFAQFVSADSVGRISIYSSGDSIAVYDQTGLLGYSPLINKPVAPGIHILRFFPVAGNTWMEAARTETLTVAGGDSLHRQIALSSLYRITTEPYGATIILGDSIAGKTPASVCIPGDVKTLQLTLPGYLKSEILLSGENHNIHSVLIPEKEIDITLQSSLIDESIKPNNLPVYASASLAVLSGVAAAYFKIKADNYYDEYRRTGYDGNLNKIRSYDRISGFSLVTGEISLGVLTYLLLKR